MDIKEMRADIDVIDDKINDLFKQRMALAQEIAVYKKENDMPVLNKQRERDILARLTADSDDEFDQYTKILFSVIFDLSRSYQERLMSVKSDLVKNIEAALHDTPQVFPQKAVVACQGIEGANSMLACEKIFSMPQIMYFNSFEGVFQAVANNMCQYGILPIENSLHGSVMDVYDLMKRHKFYIARSIKMRINHALLTKKKCRLSDIKEVYSHEQAVGQCGEFLKKLNVKINVCENTAIAAKIAADSDRDDIAAIAPRNCAEIYGLTVSADEIENNDNNYTRFICISKNLQIYPGANKVSLMFTVAHKPGALYLLIAKFASLGLNLTKLESRPIPGRDFEFMFYFDMEAPVYSPQVAVLLSELENGPEQFVFLGSYSEI